MGLSERIHEDAFAGQATAKYRARGVPSDWYVDPDDTDAAERNNSNTKDSALDRSTAMREAQDGLLGGCNGKDDAELVELTTRRNPATGDVNSPGRIARGLPRDGGAER